MHPSASVARYTLVRRATTMKMLGEEGGEERRAKFMRCWERMGEQKACGWAEKEQDLREGTTCTPIHKKIEQETLQTLLTVPPSSHIC